MPPATTPEPEPVRGPDREPGREPAGEPGGAPAAPRGSSPRGVLLAASSFCAVALVALVGVLEVPYVSLSPGPVRDVLPAEDERADEQVLVEVSGAPTYPTDGSLDLTTVSLRGGPGLEQPLWEALLAWRDPDVSVVPRALYYSPRTTQEEADAASAAEMAGSQEAAEVAALTELGIDVTATTTRRVQEVAPAAPAAGVLRPGDVITSVDGAEVADFEALKAAVGALPAGAEVRLGITRGGEAREVTTSTYAPQGETLLGIVPDVEYDSPVEVDIAIEDIGGPSAGTVFALAVVDLLTPGALTGGEHVAGTGAIRADGTVLPIGGLRQKVIGARRAGAEWFLAPAEECGEVAGVVPEGITVVGVRTLHEARTAVEAIGEGRGAEVATCAQTAAG
ncbi:YlbL family protein [Kineococcus sp. G2]|uniref:YlbL family protein n=1 Tax=Kineococcus sp. G2 TaxID=3127484 RepID=UPI00301BCC0A